MTEAATASITPDRSKIPQVAFIVYADDFFFLETMLVVELCIRTTVWLVAFF
jgi:hypothetical protein